MAEDEEMITESVGEQLRAAREAAGITLDDIAAQTRIPTRHLVSIEASEWDKLPAPTYTMGFAKSYATAVGLDRTAIADQLRIEIGGMRAAVTQPEVFESADPARVMPRWLVIAAVAAVALIVAFLLWNQSRSLGAPDNASPAIDNVATAKTGAPPTVSVPAAGGPVVITANEPVWLQVYERSGANLFQGQLASGQSFEVPPTAKAPLLRTGKPEAIRISVGTADAPSVGAAATTISDVSLLGPDLMRGPAAGARPVAAPATTGNAAPPAE